MHLTPKEQEKLLLHLAGSLAGERKSRGLKLNYVEALAYISSELLELARDGKTVVELMQLGTKILTSDDVMEGVADILGKIASRCGEGKDADDDCKKNPSMSAIIDTSIDVCRLEERIESINGKLDRFMRMFKEGVADAVNETSDKPKRRPGRRRKDA
ncbi:MAG: urease subunit gamma [Firmicutes bacterium]|nr:urease subunit gamma [Bacillota bacterium]